MTYAEDKGIERFESIKDTFLAKLEDHRDALLYHYGLERDIWDSLTEEFIRYTLPEYGPELDEDTITESAWQILDSHGTMIYTSRTVEEWISRGMPDPEDPDGPITEQIYRAVWIDVAPYAIGQQFAEAVETIADELDDTP